jgi:hypothetical protein
MSINPNNITTELSVKFANNLVRTGVISDGNCMFHAILSSYSNKYIKLSDDEKIEYVQKLRSMLPDVITKDIWLKIGYGETSRLEYGIILNNLLHEVYNHILQDEPLNYPPLQKYINSNSHICLFICKNISIKEIDEEILPKYKHDKDVYFDSTHFVKQVKKFFKSKFGKNLNEDDSLKFNSLLEKIGEFYELITRTSIELAYNHCKNQLSDNNIWIGTEYISFISELFSINIYFIDYKTGLPYIFGDEKLFPYKKSVVLLWVDNCHFEIVGIVEDDTIRRTFNSDEHLIKMIHEYTINPKNAIQLYSEFSN